MNIREIGQRDERTVAVENASCKWAYLFILFAIGIDIVYRVTVSKESVVDLIFLVIAGAGTRIAYQASQNALSRPSRKAMLFRLVGVIIAAIIAAILVIAKVM